MQLQWDSHMTPLEKMKQLKECHCSQSPGKGLYGSIHSHKAEAPFSGVAKSLTGEVLVQLGGLSLFFHRVSHMLGKCSTPELHILFVWGGELLQPARSQNQQLRMTLHY